MRTPFSTDDGDPSDNLEAADPEGLTIPDAYDVEIRAWRAKADSAAAAGDHASAGACQSKAEALLKESAALDASMNEMERMGEDFWFDRARRR